MTVCNKRILPVLLVLVVALSGCTFTWPWGKKTPMTRATPDGLYQQGLEYYQDGTTRSPWSFSSGSRRSIP